MKKMIGIATLVWLSLLCFACSAAPQEEAATADDAQLIYEESRSPNEEYAEQDEEIVQYTIRVFQDEDNTVQIQASSNSAFFEDSSYELDCDHPIVPSDVSVTWTTLMGQTDASEEDQIARADIVISSDDAVLCELSANFVSGAIKAVTETIP